MNVYLFWILFFGLWAIVPLMIIKGRTDETKTVNTVPEIKAKKKGWFKQKIIDFFTVFLSTLKKIKL